MSEASADVPVTRIEGRGLRAPVEIRGWRIGHGSSRRTESLAWAEVSIYKLEDGGYLTHRAGYSLVYHRADTHCRTRNGDQKGDPATVDDLPDDADPCVKCRPPYPQNLEDGEAIRYEFPRHTFDACETPEQVIDRLTVIRHRDGTRSVRYSQPVQDALRQAGASDSAFTRATGTVHIS